MILYRLKCAKRHEFESWFQNSAAFDALARNNHLTCPKCGSSKISKALMAPSVKSSRSRRGTEQPVAQSSKQEVAPAQAGAAPALPTAYHSASGQISPPAELVQMLQEWRRKVIASTDYVGPRFAEEARKIHYREAEARGISGEATLSEAKELHEEGIEIFPLPELPSDKN